MLTRKLLTALGIEDNKIDQIIESHQETLKDLKDEIKALKDGADDVDGLQKELETVNKKLKDAQEKLKGQTGDGFKEKYEELKTEFDEYKSGIEKKAAKEKKATAYKALLKECGVSDKRIDRIMKVVDPDLDGLELGEDGKFKTADDLYKSIKQEWSEFIEEPATQGAHTPNPFQKVNTQVPTESRAAQLARQYHDARYGAIKED